MYANDFCSSLHVCLGNREKTIYWVVVVDNRELDFCTATCFFMWRDFCLYKDLRPLNMYLRVYFLYSNKYKSASRTRFLYLNRCNGFLLKKESLLNWNLKFLKHSTLTNHSIEYSELISEIYHYNSTKSSDSLSLVVRKTGTVLRERALSVAEPRSWI